MTLSRETRRRALLAGASAVAALAATAPISAAATPDTALIRRCADFVARFTRQWELVELSDTLPWPASLDAERAARRLYADYDERLQAIADIPAVTMEGMRAKATVLMKIISVDPDNQDNLFAAALMRDLAGATQH